MLSALLLLCALGTDRPVVESLFEPVVPAAVAGQWAPTAGQTRAVVLIHGLHYHFRSQNVGKPEFRTWQYPDSFLVKELGKSSDVFIFSYGQNASLDTVVKESKLIDKITGLRKLGYGEIVLIGHSAGGLFARHFVEDYPNAGVTKVIQVAAPNGGSPLALLQTAKSQKVFLDCLTREGRQKTLKARTDRLIPPHVQFICVVGKGSGLTDSDGVVPYTSQWSADLQKQGIPAVTLPANHRQIVRDSKAAVVLANLVRETHSRWQPERVEKARKEIFGK